jgi:hypothetical protein
MTSNIRTCLLDHFVSVWVQTHDLQLLASYCGTRCIHPVQEKTITQAKFTNKTGYKMSIKYERNDNWNTYHTKLLAKMKNASKDRKMLVDLQKKFMHLIRGHVNYEDCRVWLLF